MTGKKLNGTLYTGLERTTYKFNFSVILKKKLLSAFIEITLHGEKSVKIKHISINNQKPRETF